MKGLLSVPALEELRAAYDRLQSEKPVTEVEFVRYSQWVRFDPRLGELWITRFEKDWRQLRLSVLAEANRTQPWPQCLGVLIEQLLDTSFSEGSLRRFRSALMSGVSKANGENFFIGLAPFAGRSLLGDAERPLRSYRRWGYFGREVLRNKAVLQEALSRRTQLDSRTRRKVLSDLILEKDRITVSDYLEKLEGRASPRTAQLDLQSHVGLRPVGHTRARFYVRKSRRG